MYKRILVPVDGSATSMRGVEEAMKVARAHGSRLRILNVVDEMVLARSVDMFAMADTASLVESLRATGRQALERAAALAGRRDLAVESAMRESGGRSVSDVILDEARKWRADLLVMGTHGRRGMNRMLLGSDAERVLREASVPVLLVRGEQKGTRGRKKPAASTRKG
jgi:nucleotide-binding universal stress UspA family protein